MSANTSQVSYRYLHIRTKKDHVPKSAYYSAHAQPSGLSFEYTSKNAAAIIAAGALIWRVKGDDVELLIIHRPRYDDWSWPKGKQDTGESVPETAIREICEEVNLRVRLGVPLAVTRYKVNGKTKDVFYWAAQLPAGQKPHADGHEVDQVRWVSIEKARKLLTNTTDLLPLKDFETLWLGGLLQTRPVIIARHAKAKPRSGWSAAEDERPLAGTGKRQAHSLARLLQAWAPSRVLSSPWLRCMQTVTPYANEHSIAVKDKKSLSEAGAADHPKRTAKTVNSLFEKHVPTLLCTHRPVLTIVLDVVGGYLFSKKQRGHLPTGDLPLEPGDILVLQVTASERAQVVSVEVARPFAD